MTESIAERNIDGWLAALASSDPTPGGGTAAALMAAQGAALISMVAELTVGRPNYTEHEDTMRQALTAATELRRRALAAADADAFEAVISAYRLPKTTDAEKTARSAAIQAATFAAGRAPLEVAALAADVIELAHRIEPAPTSTCSPTWPWPSSAPVPPWMPPHQPVGGRPGGGRATRAAIAGPLAQVPHQGVVGAERAGHARAVAEAAGRQVRPTDGAHRRECGVRPAAPRSEPKPGQDRGQDRNPEDLATGVTAHPLPNPRTLGVCR